MTENVTARDEGVDGRTEFPQDVQTLVPRGRWTWQIKTGGKPDVSAQVSKPGVRQDLADGRDYVMVWTNDPPSFGDVAADVDDTVKKDFAERTGLLLGLEELERLCSIHPAVMQVPGEFCARRYDSQYRRYGYRCITFYANVGRYRLTHG